jgi:hypothetical protein
LYELYDPKRTIVDLNQQPCDGDSSLRSYLARLHGSIKLPHPHPPRLSLSSGTTITTDVSSLVYLSYSSLSATEQSRLQRWPVSATFKPSVETLPLTRGATSFIARLFPPFLIRYLSTLFTHKKNSFNTMHPLFSSAPLPTHHPPR